MDETDADGAPRPDDVTNRRSAVAPVIFGPVVGAMFGTLLSGAFQWFTSPTDEDRQRQAARAARAAQLEAFIDELAKQGNPIKVQEGQPNAKVNPGEDATTPLWVWLVGGAGIGSVLGAVIGLLKYKYQDKPSNIATTIGMIFGLIPGGLLMLAGLRTMSEVGGGKFTMFLIVGAVFIGPMVGMMLAAIPDRIYDHYFAARDRSQPLT